MNKRLPCYIVSDLLPLNVYFFFIRYFLNMIICRKISWRFLKSFNQTFFAIPHNQVNMELFPLNRSMHWTAWKKVSWVSSSAISSLFVLHNKNKKTFLEYISYISSITCAFNLLLPVSAEFFHFVTIILVKK